MNLNKGQFFYEFGGCTLYVTPVTILKCDLIRGGYVYGTREERHEYSLLTRGLFPYLMSITNDTDPVVFSQAIRKRVAAIVEMEGLTSQLAGGYAQNLVARLGSHPLHRATIDARRFGHMLGAWLQGANGALVCQALELVQSYGVTPLLPSLGTVGNLGPFVCGQYKPALNSVAVQLDILARTDNPALKFLDVLLHEQVHASIYQNLGHIPARQELEWLHELAAITTSHHAITEAARSFGYDKEIRESCRKLRKEQKYGDLAQDLLDRISDPLVAWKTWQDIFMLPDGAKHQYARREILSPVLWERGWGSLPKFRPC